jgi:hypothetical protein
LRKRFKMRLVNERVRRRWLTMRDLSVRLGIPYSTLASRLREGRLPEPTRGLPTGRRRYYSEQDVDAIVAEYASKGE